MVQYVEGSLKPGKPYKQPKLTAVNCARDAETQIEEYVEQAIAKGQKVIHIYPPKTRGYAFDAKFQLAHLLKGHPDVKLVVVDSKDYE